MGVKCLWGALLAAAIAAIAPGAAAAFNSVDMPVSVSGALVYTWHGDPARGCAGAGVCGIQGALIVPVGGDSDLFVFRPRHAGLMFDGPASTVRVRRTEASSQGDCIDTSSWPESASGPATVTWSPAGRAHLVISGGPSSGRCAGPLPGDLPSVVVGRRLSGRSVRFAFVTTKAWAAGPYSGTLVSTVRVRATSRRESSSSSGSVPEPPSSPGPAPRRVFDERVRLTYRVNAAPGTIAISLRGQSDPFCAALDSCATSGGLSVAFAGRQGTLTLEGDRIVSRPVGRSRALADFRAGRLSLGLPGVSLTRRFTASETLARSGGATCTDAPGSPTQSITWLGSPYGPPPTGRLRSVPVMVETMSFSNEFLRTRCSGPFGTDVFGDNQLMARGRIGLTQLLAAHSRVAVAPRPSFSAPGYSGRLSGTLVLRLTRIKVVAGTIKALG